jgi:hypothetical protein
VSRMPIRLSYFFLHRRFVSSRVGYMTESTRGVVHLSYEVHTKRAQRLEHLADICHLTRGGASASAAADLSCAARSKRE